MITSEKSGELIVPEILPILPLRDNVIFPFVVFPLVVIEKHLVQLVNDALISSKLIGVFLQKNSEKEFPSREDMYPVGTVANVLKMFQVPDGSIRLLIQGFLRVQLHGITQQRPYLMGSVKPVDIRFEQNMEIEALTRGVSESFQKMVTLSPVLPDELKVIIGNIKEPDRMADMVASSLNIDVQEKQSILEEFGVKNRLTKVMTAINKEIQLLELNDKIQTEVNAELSKTQRDYFLREQIKAIRHELGDDDDDSVEIEELGKKIAKRKMPKEAKKIAGKELERLAQMSPSSAEYTVSKTYIDWILELPWQTKTKDQINIVRAKKILDDDHYDLEDVKNRILEFLAVRKLRKDSKSPILCFLGPPGVGKTSLGKSIAKAIGRRFVRFSLGGVKDEAEIRGHRRTYIGALPGKILQELRRAQSSNPVFMLDEIDKIGQDFRGDPASALLEVLDPEQNNTFTDHYVDIPFDLSNVMFIATANDLSPIPPALLDRMEVIRLSGYIAEDKLEIAKKYIVPRQIKENGLKPKDINFNDDSILQVIASYTWESGVRNLEREIANICRKVARKKAEGGKSKAVIKIGDIIDYLGPQKIFPEMAHRENEIGVATGLAWTQNGGEILFIEARLMQGNRGLQLTGQLGEVMKESAQAGLSYIRSKASILHINPSVFNKMDIHIHIPSGATPKDGPSAGVTIVTCLTSLMTGRPVKHNVAMTGEITLRGKVLAVGGIREKVVAARRAGINTVIMPKMNKNDLEDVPDYVKKSLQFIYVEHIDEVLKHALLNKPVRYNGVRKNKKTLDNGKVRYKKSRIVSDPAAKSSAKNTELP
ncbi:endopeptidase La [bacterium]|nr:MAG: endopeptidase La [bacterium]